MGFSHGVTGEDLFQKDHLGCQARMDLSETQQCLWSISQLAPAEIQVRGEDH